MLKRLFDIVVSFIALVILSPIILITIFCVAYSMGRPVFFKQQRPGKEGDAFHLIKIRTMICCINSNEKTPSDSDRITALGHFLRKSSLDELPSLFNVLRGDMSLVGPRPLLMEYLPLYSSEQNKRHKVRPGITGWAQVNGRNAIDWDEKFKLDVWYVENQSFMLDINILLKTVLKVLLREGISHKNHETMPLFTGKSSIKSYSKDD